MFCPVQSVAMSNRHYSCSLMLSCHSAAAWQPNWSKGLIV